MKNARKMEPEMSWKKTEKRRFSKMDSVHFSSSAN